LSLKHRAFLKSSGKKNDLRCHRRLRQVQNTPTASCLSVDCAAKAPLLVIDPDECIDHPVRPSAGRGRFAEDDVPDDRAYTALSPVQGMEGHHRERTRCRMRQWAGVKDKLRNTWNADSPAPLPTASPAASSINMPTACPTCPG
jgi:hypothetical protein